MGDFSDDMEFYVGSYEYELQRCDDLIHSRSWETKDGRTIKIKDMTTSHLNNTINMFKDVDHLKELINIMIEELETRNNK